jgi:hypothetical protein
MKTAVQPKIQLLHYRESIEREARKDQEFLQERRKRSAEIMAKMAALTGTVKIKL